MVEKFIICDATAPATCAFCRKVKELRPYGPQGQSICFDCAMHDEKTTGKQFLKRFEQA